MIWKEILIRYGELSTKVATKWILSVAYVKIFVMLLPI